MEEPGDLLKDRLGQRVVLSVACEIKVEPFVVSAEIRTVQNVPCLEILSDDFACRFDHINDIP